MQRQAAIAYNRWLRYYKIDKDHEPIRNGDKIKWTFLKPNPLGLETVALKGYKDPSTLIEYIGKYMDYEVLFDNELKNKLEKFYVAMKWGLLPTDMNKKVSKFFSF